jgi:hypothetical protein
MKKNQYWIDSEIYRNNAIAAIRLAPLGQIVEIKEPKRDDVMNRKMWAMLDDVANQVVQHGKLRDRKYWKGVFTAALDETLFVPSLEGDKLVLLDEGTRYRSNKWFSDLFELIYSFCSDKNVIWSEPAVNVIEEYLMSVG